MTCQYCNKTLPDGSEFCSNCGSKVQTKTLEFVEEKRNDIIFEKKSNTINTNYYSPSNITQTQKNERADVLRKIAEYEKTSGIIWIVVGIIQCLSVVGIICGIWNIIIGTQRLKYSKSLAFRPNDIYKNFEGQLTSLIIILIINIFLGAIIGVVGAIFDLFVRNFVIENKDIISGNYIKNTNTVGGNYLEDIKSLKELLDDGAISQEEFDAKKKELLGL